MHRKGGDQERIRRVLLGETASQERARVHAQVRECWPETSYIYTRAVCCGETSNFNNTNQRGKTSGKKTPNMHQNNPLKKIQDNFSSRFAHSNGERVQTPSDASMERSRRGPVRDTIFVVCAFLALDNLFGSTSKRSAILRFRTTYLVPGTVFIILLYDVFHRRTR